MNHVPIFTLFSSVFRPAVHRVVEDVDFEDLTPQTQKECVVEEIEITEYDDASTSDLDNNKKECYEENQSI